ncbi:MAG: hypothetical protein HWN51_00790 [Desulfobacterales bacterium]|nr:hypothetical protein [Desulfobacterales bacterium]
MFEVTEKASEMIKEFFKGNKNVPPIRGNLEVPGLSVQERKIRCLHP